MNQVEAFSKALNAAVDHSKLLITRNGEVEFFTNPNDGNSYSGWVKKNHSNGKLGYLFHCSEGKQDGLYTAWHDNGVKMVERTWVRGVRSGPFKIWTGSGILESRGFNADNLRHGLFEEFYGSGNKKSEVVYKNGKIDAYLRWRPDGGLCLLTSLVQGKGIVVHYKEDGTIDSNDSYFEGVLDYGQSSHSGEMSLQNTEDYDFPIGENSTTFPVQVELNDSSDENFSKAIDNQLE